MMSVNMNQSPAMEILGDPNQQANAGMKLSDDPWVRHIPYLADRLGVHAGAKMPGATIVLPLADGREYDMFLIAHRLLDVIEVAVGRSAAAIDNGQKLLGNDRSLQEQIVALGARLGPVEQKLGIEPQIGPVEQPNQGQPQGQMPPSPSMSSPPGNGGPAAGPQAIPPAAPPAQGGPTALPFKTAR